MRNRVESDSGSDNNNVNDNNNDSDHHSNYPTHVSAQQNQSQSPTQTQRPTRVAIPESYPQSPASYKQHLTTRTRTCTHDESRLQLESAIQCRCPVDVVLDQMSSATLALSVVLLYFDKKYIYLVLRSVSMCVNMTDWPCVTTVDISYDNDSIS